MGPSGAETLQSLGETPQMERTDFGSLRSRDLCCEEDNSYFSSTSIPESRFELKLERAHCGETSPLSSSIKRQRSERRCRLVRRPSKISLGAVSLTANSRPHTTSSLDFICQDGEQLLQVPQRSQSDVIKQAIMAARDMKKTLEATKRMELTLQESIGDLDVALTRLKVITCNKQRANSLRTHNKPTKYRASIQQSSMDGELPEDGLAKHQQHQPSTPRPLTAEPVFMSYTSYPPSELQTPSDQDFPQFAIQSPFGDDALSDFQFDPTIGDSSSMVFDLDDLMSLGGFHSLSQFNDAEEDNDSDLTVYIVFDVDGSEITVPLIDFQEWLLAQEESWC